MKVRADADPGKGMDGFEDGIAGVKEIARRGTVIEDPDIEVLEAFIETALRLFGENERLREERDLLARKAQELEESAERARLLAGEKDVLIRELRHRVKDGLSNLISLYALQAESAGDGAVCDALMHARSQIQCMDVLYSKVVVLWGSPWVSAREYFDEILPEIYQALSPPCPVSLISEIDDALLPADCMFPIGLIANELISSVVKNAFHGRERGSIGVALHVGEGSECELTIRDDGIVTNGPLLPSGFGAIIVEAMTSQLRGKLELRLDPGTEYSISFPVGKPPRDPAIPA